MSQVKHTSEETYPEQSKSFEETSKLLAEQVKEKEKLKTEVDMAIDETNTMNKDKLKANKAEVEANNKDSEPFIKSKSEKVAKGKGKKGKDKKAKAEAGKDPMLEAKRFETQAKDKAEAAEMVRLEDEKAGAEKIAITKTEKDEIVLGSKKVRTEVKE